jgi:hypothetical protein
MGNSYRLVWGLATKRGRDRGANALPANSQRQARRPNHEITKERNHEMDINHCQILGSPFAFSNFRAFVIL